jgi:hypothetical protein
MLPAFALFGLLLSDLLGSVFDRDHAILALAKTFSIALFDEDRKGAF